MQQGQQLAPLGLCQDTEYAGGALAARGVELVEQASAGGGQFHQRRASVRRIVATRHDSGDLRAIHAKNAGISAGRAERGQNGRANASL